MSYVRGKRINSLSSCSLRYRARAVLQRSLPASQSAAKHAHLHFVTEAIESSKHLQEDKLWVSCKEL